MTTKVRSVAETKNKVVKKVKNEIKDKDKLFISEYIRTGDGINAAMTAYKYGDVNGAALKSAIMLSDPAVLELIDKKLFDNIPKTADDTSKEVWKLYRECIDKGHRIKAIELYAKLKGHLTTEVVNNNYQSWNILIKQGSIAKEREAPVITEVVPE